MVNGLTAVMLIVAPVPPGGLAMGGRDRNRSTISVGRRGFVNASLLQLVTVFVMNEKLNATTCTLLPDKAMAAGFANSRAFGARVRWSY
jgi:hypothetical protein